jgi:hypothetical protein
MGTKRTLKTKAVSKAKPKKAKPTKKITVKKLKVVSKKFAPKKSQQLNPFYWLWGGVAAAFVTVVMLSNFKHDNEPKMTAKTEMRMPASRASMSTVESVFDQMKAANFEKRISAWSAFLQNSPFAGEFMHDMGKMAPKVQDNAPLIAKHFDCTTYTETVFALAKSNTPADFFKNLIAIRYKKSGTGYMDRNHFPEADWIPNNASAGILKDITMDVAKDSGIPMKTAMKRIDRGKWLTGLIGQGKEDRKLASLVETSWGSPVDVELNYVGIDQIDSALKSIPSGTVVNIVREPKDRKPVMVTHQGFIIQENGKTLIRHSSVHGKIRTRPLMDYLHAINKESASWPVIGLNFNRFN